MKGETPSQLSKHSSEHLTPLDPYGYQLHSPAQTTTSVAMILRIGLAYYDQNSTHSASEAVTLQCVICDQFFSLESICGVAADQAYAFVGNVCFDCLAMSVESLRQQLAQTAARLRAYAAASGDDEEEQIIAKRLLIEASSRERWAAGELQHPGKTLLANARKRNIPWKKYGLLKELTTITYQAWFGEEIP